jgi:hypothetical protein
MDSRRPHASTAGSASRSTSNCAPADTREFSAHLAQPTRGCGRDFAGNSNASALSRLSGQPKAGAVHGSLVFSTQELSGGALNWHFCVSGMRAAGYPLLAESCLVAAGSPLGSDILQRHRAGCRAILVPLLPGST